MSREHNLGDFAISGPVHPGIQRAQCKREPLAAVGRKRMERRSLRSAIKTSPQAPARIDPKFEVAVERKFNGVASSEDRRLFEPNAVLYAVEMHHGVPAVRALTQRTVVQVAKVQVDARMRADDQRRTDWYDRHQDFGRPEDSLLKIGLTRISCEKPTPNSGGTQSPRWCQNRMGGSLTLFPSTLESAMPPRNSMNWVARTMVYGTPAASISFSWASLARK